MCTLKEKQWNSISNAVFENLHFRGPVITF